ncbi:hypothetical protein GGS24DRAFT_95474 [Hypoxylon argillaceum]|nr:hypothetical protein GGS24DRAFT_95474 [Hypoxylon argillaceum]
MEEQLDVEILVHIGAPSRAVDDARYRSLAAAYLAYEPEEAVYFYPQSSHDSSERGGSNAQTIQGLRPQEAGDSPCSIMPSQDRIGFIQSPQASFGSVVDNVGSPRIHMCEMPNHAFLQQQTPASGTQSSWQTPPSIVQDSHPTNHANFTSLTSPTRVLENYLQHFNSPSSLSGQNSQSSGLAGPYKHISQHKNRRLSPRNRVPCTPRMIPCTPQVSNRAEPSPNRREKSEWEDNIRSQQQHPALAADVSDDDIIEETKFLSSSQPSPLTRAGSEPLPKLRKLELITSPHALARASSDIGPQPLPGHQAPVTIEFLSTHGFTYESLEIRPPEPPISEPHGEPQDLITQGLQNLGHDVGLTSRFQPKEQRRELRPYERGHWLVDCSSWEPRLKRDAWAFLANYIGTGIAGWGVWCKRNTDFEELRVYCWGSVVVHIYYVLWLSSQRRIRFTESSWVDAEGTKVITMASRGLP